MMNSAMLPTVTVGSPAMSMRPPMKIVIMELMPMSSMMAGMKRASTRAWARLRVR
jgi:hypothetical protein